MDELEFQLDFMKAMNQKLSGKDRMYRMVCDISESAFLYYDFKLDEIVILGNWEHYFEVTPHDLKDMMELYDEFSEVDKQPFRDSFFLEKLGEAEKKIECRLTKKRLFVELKFHVNYDEEGKPVDKIIRIQDITKFKAQNEELSYLAYYDGLTGLYNRNYFVKLLSEYVNRAELDNSIVSVLFIDIDEFKKINDGYGLIIGDELVQVFGQFLNEFSSDYVKVCHIGSDIFCMAIYQPCGARSVEHLHQKIQERTKQGYKLSTGITMHITVSIGVAEYPEASNSPIELINYAEIVMFKAKEKLKTDICYFDTTILKEFLDNVALEKSVKTALKEKRLFLCFQPLFEASTKRLRGAEALLRMKDEKGNILWPTDFVPIAEKNGAILEIGQWVIEEAIRVFSDWRKKYDKDLVIAINISAVQYKAKDFVPKLIDVIRKYQMEPKAIELEITESVFVEHVEEVKEKMNQLRDYGIRVSIDDFGTGYSSLTYLKGLPIDTLKIDKSFIDSIVSDRSSQVITDAIIEMVRKLGYSSIAEGVEQKEQYEYLKNSGCDMIQGFFFGKPLEEDKFEHDFLND